MLKYIFSVKLDQVHSSLRGEREKSPKRVCLVIRLERSYYSSSHDSGLDMRASGLGCSSAGPSVVSWVLRFQPQEASELVLAGSGILGALCASLRIETIKSHYSYWYFLSETENSLRQQSLYLL